MSNIRYLQSQCDRAFREDYSRRFPGFEKPQIIPAATIRQGMGVTYLSRYIDQDPNSFYMFIQGNPLNGDVSRDAACQLFEDFFYEKMHMPSSYDIAAGGEYSREQAIDKEVLPARSDSAYRTYYEEQMDRLRAMEQGGDAETPAADADDDVIDVEQGSDGVFRSAADRSSSERSVQTSAGTAVAMPKRIFYAVDFHIPAGGGMLGYNRGENRLNGRRSSGFLRENKPAGNKITKRNTDFDTYLDHVYTDMMVLGHDKDVDSTRVQDELYDVITQQYDIGADAYTAAEVCSRYLSESKTLKEELKFEKDAIGRTVVAEEDTNDLDEFEPEEDGSEYYGKVMEKAAAIPDDEVDEDDAVDPELMESLVQLERKIR